MGSATLNKEDIIAAIEKMTVLELNELVKELEEKLKGPEPRWKSSRLWAVGCFWCLMHDLRPSGKWAAGGKL